MPGVWSVLSRVRPLGDRVPPAHDEVEEVLLRDHPEPVGEDRVGHGVGDERRGGTLGDRPAHVVSDDLRRRGERWLLAELGRPVAVGVHDLGAHPAGAQHADPDGEAGHRHRVVQALADRDHGVLRRVVGRREAGVEPGDRRRVDDVAAPDEMRQERPAAVHDAPEVDAHHPLPRAERPEPRVGLGGDAGVVAHDVDAAEALERRLPPARRPAPPC